MRSTDPATTVNKTNMPTLIDRSLLVVAENRTLTVSSIDVAYVTATATATATTGATPNIVVDVTNHGTNYYTAPTVTLSGGSGSGALATAILSGGTVTGVIVIGATGYLTGDDITVSILRTS